MCLPDAQVWICGDVTLLPVRSQTQVIKAVGSANGACASTSTEHSAEEGETGDVQGETD